MDQADPVLLEALMRKDFPQRLRQALKEAGVKQKSVADQLGVKPQSVNQWLTGRSMPKREHETRLAQMANTTREWLFEGKGDPSANYASDLTPIDNNSGRELPLLPLEEMSRLMDGGEVPTTGRPLIRSHYRCGPRAAAFKMQGRSMEPRVNPGDIVVIDPDETLEPGNLVAAYIKNLDITVFRQFSFAPGDRRVLTPINPQHQIFEFSAADWDSQVAILGVMTERSEPGKK